MINRRFLSPSGDPDLRSTRSRGDDAGQAAIPFIVVLSLVLVWILAQVQLPLGEAADAGERTQAAADAAALAGATEVRDEWVMVHTRAGVVRFGQNLRFVGGGGGGWGRSRASDYAVRNGSNLIGYRFNRGLGRAYVEVRENGSGTRDRARSRATAELDLDVERCEWTPVTVVVPPAPPAGPDRFLARLRCGPWVATYEVVNAPPAYPTTRLVGTTETRLRAGLEPRLVR